MRILRGGLRLILLAVVFSFQALGAEPSEPKWMSVYKTDDIVWGLDFLSDRFAVATRKDGQVLHLDLAARPMAKARVLPGGPPSIEKGQGGLHDIRVKVIGTETYVYFTSAVAKGDGQSLALFRAKWKGSPDAGTLGPIETLFTAEPAVDSGYHFGGRLAFGTSKADSGKLFVSIGERNQRERAQNLSQHWGKVVRLNLDGTVPTDNPYVGGKVAGARPEIYSYGHRNPQGLAVHPGTGQVFVSEHGPRGGDEINLILAGKNYGWPIVTYGREYSGPAIGEGFEKPGMESPLKYYVPSIAPSSLMIYSGKKHKDWGGQFFLGALALQHLNLVEFASAAASTRPVAKKETRLFTAQRERIRHVVESPSGDVFVSTDSGHIVKLER